VLYVIYGTKQLNLVLLADYPRRTTSIANRHPQLRGPSIDLQHVRHITRAFEAQYRRLIGQLQLKKLKAREYDMSPKHKNGFLCGMCRCNFLAPTYLQLSQHTSVVGSPAQGDPSYFRFQNHPQTFAAQSPQSRHAYLNTIVPVKIFRTRKTNNSMPISLVFNCGRRVR
jgi:hypothetical protein